MMRKILVLLSVAAVCLTGCSTSNPKTLTRSKAKEMLEASKFLDPSKPTISLTKTDMEQGEKAGYWHVQRGTQTDCALTPEGQKVFSSAACYISPEWGGTVNPTAALKPKIVEVTGISGASATYKEVEFTWTWDWSALPSDAQHIFDGHPPEKQTAAFRLYDEGWRVVE
jgi:hypothetical protein